MALSFGVTSTGGYGVLQSLSETQTAEIADARDATGKVTDQQAYSKTAEATAEGLFNGDSLGGAGTSLTIGSVVGLITNQSITETNTDYKRVSVTVQKKDSATQVALS
jgi:hypothetical protein